MDELENTRKIFMDELIKLAKDNKKIVVLDPDVGEATYTWDFFKAYPDRFYEFGIAEQNAFGAASGLASTGLTVFAATFAVFSSMRACEMVRTSICYPKRNVKVIGGYAGISNGKDGATHQSIEDVSIMRSFPNMVVMAISDQIVTEKIVDTVIDYEGPVYIRMEYELMPKIHKEDLSLKIGKSYIAKEGNDITLISYGTALARTMEAARILKESKIDAEVIDCPSIKPFDKGTFISSIKKTGRLVTLEDHSVIGGLATIASEVIVESGIYPKFKKLAIMDIFTESGSTQNLRKRYKIDTESVVSAAKSLI